MGGQPLDGSAAVGGQPLDGLAAAVGGQPLDGSAAAVGGQALDGSAADVGGQPLDGSAAAAVPCGVHVPRWVQTAAHVHGLPPAPPSREEVNHTRNEPFSSP